MVKFRGTNDFANKAGDVHKIGITTHSMGGKGRKAGDVRKSKITSATNPQIKLDEFRALVWKYWKENGRHDLAWRKTKNPYRILVSEVMLQQTQVSRVVEKYAEFLHAFPTVESLAQARLADVLKVWSGMGYNRRAKFLKTAAEEIVRTHKGKVPRDATLLRALPGIGPYTASAVLVFAYNLPDTLLETNVRAAYIHHFFSKESQRPGLGSNGGPASVASYLQKNYKGAASVLKTLDNLPINDRELLPLIAAAAEGQDPREWHWALMDYGSYLKRTYPNPSRKSAHHTVQSKFEGSLRQVRGAILRELHQGPSSVKDLPFEKARIEDALAGLARDGLIIKTKGKWKIV